ncbi:MAG: hypothetical protein ACK4JY_03665 [Brevundimonas sp.]|uniref:hypothetical protein n=1 Tax=Brevundimonas sp. TaxID=1871086 RepID=UPI00391AD6F1
MKLDWYATIGGMVVAQQRGATFKWMCQGCARAEPLDLADYHRTAGPNYSLWNEISVCPCGAPRTLYGSSGSGTPFMPLKDEWLWLLAEVGYGRDPDAWFEIIWWDAPP